MGLIRVLPEQVTNQISAGEVIERPASIVKELVENALDAGATSVEVEIKHGGKSLVRVSDNGSGMDPEDARLAFQRYATSKIACASDLSSICSYGFRGEALPSIAAVSRTKLTTRTTAMASGFELSIEGGSILAQGESPCRPGTIVEVRDLFYNTPARRKFMRAESTEMGHIIDVIGFFSLARPEVRFLLKSGDKVVLDLVPMNRAIDRAPEIFGDEIAKQIIEFEAQAPGIQIQGFLGKPSVAKNNRQGQIFFVNQRWVRSLSFGYAIQDGYHGLLMHGQFPIACLFLDVDASRVDVNVHPTKQEVKISQEAEIKSFIKKTVFERLAKENDLAPLLRITSPEVRKGNQNYQYPAFLRLNEPLKVQDSTPDTAHTAQPLTAETFMPERVSVEPELAPFIPIKNKLQVTKILGQIHSTFIIAETDEGMIVVDQHAAHERIMFELLLKDFVEGNAQKQGLLMDEILEIPVRQRELLEQSLSFLQKSGFDIEAFGEDSFAVRAYPAVLNKEDPVACIKNFLDQLEEGKLRTDLHDHQEEIAALIACKRRSVKARESLTALELQSLLVRLGACENPFNCPHGRPTFFKHTFQDLEKQFKRK